MLSRDAENQTRTSNKICDFDASVAVTDSKQVNASRTHIQFTNKTIKMWNTHVGMEAETYGVALGEGVDRSCFGANLPPSAFITPKQRWKHQPPVVRHGGRPPSQVRQPKRSKPEDMKIPAGKAYYPPANFAGGAPDGLFVPTYTNHINEFCGTAAAAMWRGRNPMYSGQMAHALRNVPSEKLRNTELFNMYTTEYGRSLSKSGLTFFETQRCPDKASGYRPYVPPTPANTRPVRPTSSPAYLPRAPYATHAVRTKDNKTTTTAVTTQQLNPPANEEPKTHRQTHRRKIQDAKPQGSRPVVKQRPESARTLSTTKDFDDDNFLDNQIYGNADRERERRRRNNEKNGNNAALPPKPQVKPRAWSSRIERPAWKSNATVHRPMSANPNPCSTNHFGKPTYRQTKEVYQKLSVPMYEGY